MSLPAVDTLATTLKDTFGFTAFRPLQREIMEDTLAGRDVLALLPTGGGKSLCYQLPAIVRSGLTLVVSPLIALMKDQVDSLLENGVKAAYLNSSLSDDASKDTWRQLFRGEIRILYLSPERLLVDGMLDTLEQLKLEFVAVDEAHCISSWGHDFRPEYRALKAVRARFPQVPMLALTASATERVRRDIVEMLELRNPRNFVACAFRRFRSPIPK
jgi:ATP-dependent DNA helicase RecQ